MEEGRDECWCSSKKGRGCRVLTAVVRQQREQKKVYKEIERRLGSDGAPSTLIDPVASYATSRHDHPTPI